MFLNQSGPAIAGQHWLNERYSGPLGPAQHAERHRGHDSNLSHRSSDSLWTSLGTRAQRSGQQRKIPSRSRNIFGTWISRPQQNLTPRAPFRRVRGRGGPRVTAPQAGPTDDRLTRRSPGTGSAARSFATGDPRTQPSSVSRNRPANSVAAPASNSERRWRSVSIMRFSSDTAPIERPIGIGAGGEK